MMTRSFSSFALVASLFLSSNHSLVLAQTPEKAQEFPGNDQFQNGWMFDQGLGQKIDSAEAIRNYRAAADLGNPLAKGRLARIYFMGKGVPENKAEAERLSKGIFEDVQTGEHPSRNGLGIGWRW